MGAHSPQFFAAVDENVDYLTEATGTQGIANTAWASAKLNYNSSKLFALLETRSDYLW
eukprot:CAMPEP_0202466134 /NCGR_PEP_ID=MMETSP1360-20130828/67707_1 /ASSEMBLY_ACC=CAM_ASM_000848 /TAXON_ID=515479 /ORGANISM="Licmophora paradoxa, Strain CCMP2313" /LENGTH=57 /DNA_ID=CAMNT_0049090157 /DNA_START=75 /DNA_END=245 /DNA_ORIENTATION=-